MFISQHYVGESTEFHGIADDQEQTIRFTEPVEVVKYGFVSGQEVITGALIVEVRQPDIDAELAVVQDQIHALSFGNREARTSMHAEIVRLQADQQVALSELDSQIRTLQARQSVARTYFDGLNDESPGASTPLQQEIDSMVRRKQALKRATAARVNDFKSKLGTSERPVDAQIAELENRRLELERQRDGLTVYAERSGRVGSVLFKVGDTVAPYQPVLTVHGSRPTFIKGFIHENVLNDIRIGQTVWVQSANSVRGEISHAGVVESLGTRIVEFPARLKVNPLSHAWGREVVVQLHNDHALMLGEKVNVQLDQPDSVFAEIKTLLAEVSL